MSILAWSDLHGRMDIFERGLSRIGPKDKVYFLGDAADRGPDGWKIMKRILEDKRFTYIKGNHEDLMLKVLGDWKGPSEAFHYTPDIDLWYWNGGEPTYTAFLDDHTICAEQKRDYLDQLEDLPFCAIYQNAKDQIVILSHSGYSDVDNGDEEKFIWDRNHLMFYDTWDGNDNEVVVHGHTPIELMIEEQQHNAEWLTEKHMHEGILGDHFVEPQPWDGKSAYWYGKNHKVNIDTGAVWNNRSVLLNLDTWEETHIFIPMVG